MRLTILFVFLLCSGLISAQINFFKLYTDAGDDFGEGVVQLEDSSYVVTGASSSFVNGASQAFLLKVDSLGNFLWSNHYGGFESETGKRVLYRPGDGFYVAGTTSSYGGGAYDYYLFKTDLSGNLVWENSYGGAGWDRVMDATLTSDGGIIMVGENSSNPTDNRNIYIVKTNLLGDTLWTKTIGGPEEDFASSVDVYNDSILVIGGSVYSQDSLLNKALFMGVHENGTVLWVDSIGDNGHYEISDLCIHNDFVYAVGTSVVGGETNNSQYHLRKSLIDGAEIENNLGVQGDYYAENVMYDTIMDRVKIAYTYLDQNSVDNSLDFALRKYHPNLNNIPGNIVALPYPGTDRAGEIIQTSDGGMMLVGRTESQYTSYHHIFLAKVGVGDVSPNSMVPHTEEQLVGAGEIVGDDLSYQVHPNPATESVHINGPNLSVNNSVIIYDSFGRVSLQSKVGDINIASLASGFYSLGLLTEDGQVLYRARFIKQ